MRSLSAKELDILIESLQGLRGASLREAEVADDGVALCFWTKGAAFWLWFEANVWAPLLLPLNRPPVKSAKPARPLLLFLRAHFLGGRLQKAWRDEKIGRLIILEFGEGKQIEIRLWPHGANCIARTSAAKVAWARIEEIKSLPQEYLDQPTRTWSEILDEWESLKRPRFAEINQKRDESLGPEKRGEAEKAFQKERRRLEKAIGKVRDEMAAKTKIPYRKIGRWLSENQSLNVPSEYAPFIDGRRKFSWNLEQIFAKAKDLERKVVITQLRLNKLERDLAKHNQISDVGAWFESLKKGVKRADRREPGRSQFRTLNLESGVRAFLGKSGLDNLALLRQARAWDLWLHLKDFPGGHAVLRRDKNQRVTDQDFRQVAMALVEQSFGAKASRHQGEKFELLVAECRFVRPIKGDRHGRVNYSRERVVPFQYQKARPDF